MKGRYKYNDYIIKSLLAIHTTDQKEKLYSLDVNKDRTNRSIFNLTENVPEFLEEEREIKIKIETIKYARNLIKKPLTRIFNNILILK